MALNDFQKRAWAVDKAYTAYSKALKDLYKPDSELAGSRIRGAGKGSSDLIKQRSQSVLDQSRNFGYALVNALDTDDLNQRELAGWKLLAAAASDLSTASVLLDSNEVKSRSIYRGKTRSGFEAVPELKRVLETPFEPELVKLTKTTRKTLLIPKDPEAAKEQLKKTIATFLDIIPDSAANISKAAAGELLAAGLSPFKQIVSNLAQEIFEHLPTSTSFVVNHAASILAEAIRKIEAALGDSSTGQVKEEVASWLKEIAGIQDKATKLLNKLYEIKRIENEISVFFLSAPKNTPADSYNQATRILEGLLDRYMMTRKILDGVMKVLGFVKTPLLAAAPWGPIGVYGSYTGILAYAIFSGGDYLDWYRLGEKAWLDRVSGLRTTVRNSLEKKESTIGHLQSPTIIPRIRVDHNVDRVSGGGEVIGFQLGLPTANKKRIKSKSTKDTTIRKGKKKDKKTTGENARFQKMKKKELLEEKIRLDVHTPERVVVEKTFEISIAVRQPESPLPAEPGMPKVVSKPGKIFREISEDIVKYRVKVIAPDCKIHSGEAIFLLKSGSDSETHYFQLTAKKEGIISILVQAYQENEILAADTRVTLTATLEAKPANSKYQKDRNMNRTKILFFASNPQNTNILNLGEEVRAITRKIRESEYRDSLEFITAWAARPTDLLDEMNKHIPTILHFSGHGSGEEGLVFTNSQGKSELVSTDALKTLFSEVKNDIRLVVFNACFSVVQGKAISKIIECVVGMNKSIGDEAAISFAAYFYSSIAYGHSVKDAFAQGKTALMLLNIPEEKTPVLLCRKDIDPDYLYLVNADEVDYSKIQKIGTDDTGKITLQDINGSKVTVNYNDITKLEPLLQNLSDTQTFEVKQLIGREHKEILTEIRKIQNQSDEKNTILEAEKILDGLDDFFKELTAMKIENAKNRIITNYKLLREYEEMIILENDPILKMRYQKEIEKRKNYITTDESELKSILK